MNLTALQLACLMMRSRLSALHDEDRGVTTLETVLWIGGLAVLAIAVIAVITLKVNTATGNIPTGP